MENLNVYFLSVVGSHIYGLADEHSDFDFKGFGFIDDIRYHLGVKHFEQTEAFENIPEELQKKILDRYGKYNDGTPRPPKDYKDITVYDIKKFFFLASSCNPTIIELLYVDPKWVLVTSPVYDYVRKNRDLFLTRKVRDSYVGYAVSQLKRIERHKKWIDNPVEKPNREDYNLPKQPRIKKEHMNALAHLPNDVFKDKIGDEIHREIDYNKVLGNYQDYSTWKKNRNPARAKLEEKFGFDLKHGRHLARLLLQGEELIETGNLTVEVVKTVNGQFILDIKNGLVKFEDLVKWAENKMTVLREKVETSVLPKKLDGRKIEDLLIKLVSMPVYDKFIDEWMRN